MQMIGQTAGSYRILRELGRGGMGVVYLAVHPLIGKRAAIKMLLPRYSANPELLRRFFNEGRAIAQLEHPGSVQILDYGNHESGRAFLILEFLEGESIGARCKRVGT